MARDRFLDDKQRQYNEQSAGGKKLTKSVVKMGVLLTAGALAHSLKTPKKINFAPKYEGLYIPECQAWGAEYFTEWLVSACIFISIAMTFGNVVFFWGLGWMFFVPALIYSPLSNAAYHSAYKELINNEKKCVTIFRDAVNKNTIPINNLTRHFKSLWVCIFIGISFSIINFIYPMIWNASAVFILIHYLWLAHSIHRIKKVTNEYRKKYNIKG